MKRIVIAGPECCGKTTLSEALAANMGGVLVQEFARTYLAAIERAYEQDDLLTIAKGQLDAEQTARVKSRLQANTKYSARFKIKSNHKQLIVCDTDLRTLRIWSLEKYDAVHDWIEKTIAETKTDLYLLCKPDMVWEADPQRENPDDRDRLYELYKADLEASGQKFVEVEGTPEKRLLAAMRAVDRL